MKSNQLAKRPVLETEHDGAEADRPIWFLGKELKARPADDASHVPSRVAKSAKVAASQMKVEPAERRPSQLEAYMRYAKMREPHEDEMLAPIVSKGHSRGGYAL